MLFQSSVRRISQPEVFESFLFCLRFYIQYSAFCFICQYFSLLCQDAKKPPFDGFRASNSTTHLNVHSAVTCILPLVMMTQPLNMYDSISFVACHAIRCCTVPRQSRRCRRLLQRNQAAAEEASDSLQRHLGTSATLQ